MNIERRKLQDLYQQRPDDVVRGHLFADGSPVTGMELQGMVLQLAMVGWIFLTFVLPGICTHYGHQGVIDKAMALILSLLPI